MYIQGDLRCLTPAGYVINVICHDILHYDNVNVASFSFTLHQLFILSYSIWKLCEEFANIIFNALERILGSCRVAEQKPNHRVFLVTSVCRLLVISIIMTVMYSFHLYTLCTFESFSMVLVPGIS